MDTHRRHYFIYSIRIIWLLSLLLAALVPNSLAQEQTRPEVSTLIKDLKDPDARVRFRAVLDLSSIRGTDKEAIPALIEALKDQSDSVRLYAPAALAHIGKDAYPALVELLKNQDPSLR